MSHPLIFISYSHKDEKWKELLKEQLVGALQQEDNLKIWSDSSIGGGEDWYQEISVALQNANVAVLLVSAASLGSDFIRKEEVPRLLERRKGEGLKIFPVIISDCAWKQRGWLAAMQVRPKGGIPLDQKTKPKRATELKDIVVEILQILGAAAGETDPAISQVQVQAPDQATPKVADEGEKERLNKLEAEVARLRKERDEFKSRYLSQRQPTSQKATGYGEEPVKPTAGESQKTTQDKDKPQF
jgi:hypothetical protein